MKWRRRLFARDDSDKQKQLEECGGNPLSKTKSATKKKDKTVKKKDKKEQKSLKVVIPSRTASIDSKESDKMPRISMELSMVELQEEAMARGIDLSILPTNKNDLLNFLVDGSIHLRKTSAWQDVQRLKTKMEADCRRIEEEKKTFEDTACSSGVISERDHFRRVQSEMESRQHQFQSHGEHANGSNMLSQYKQRVSSAREDLSLLDMSSFQSTLPTFFTNPHTVQLRQDPSFQSNQETLFLEWIMPSFHVPLGCSATNMCKGAEGEKELLSDTTIEIAKLDNTLQKERQQEKELDDLLARRNKIKETKVKENVEMQRQVRQKWDASLQFEPWIVSPPTKNMTPNGSLMKGFTIWCSLSSDLNPIPDKQFDTTYKSLGDANDRARFLFYWLNPWGLAPQKMVEVVHIKADNSGNNECANTFHCVHPNADKWIVSVVNDATFRYLDNASMIRHSLDRAT
jgi:hypothetical protein